MSVTRKALHRRCTHCGLPIPGVPAANQETLFCCHACRLAAMIVGKQQEQGPASCHLLRLGFGTLLAMNIMMISLLMYSGSIEEHTLAAFRMVLLVLSLLALIVLLPPFLKGSLQEMKSFHILIAGGSLTAFGVSAFNTLNGTGGLFFDTATMLPVLVTFGTFIESSAKRRASDLLESLDSLLPASAKRITCSGLEEVATALLQPGDMIRVLPGERIPVDGCIMEGNTTIEEAPFTGEFLPRLCGPGDSVIAGTVNGTGSLVVIARQTGDDLLLNNIAEMIDTAWCNPSTAECIAERAAKLFIPLVLMIATGSLVVWTAVGNPAQGWLSALAVLVVACPCTIGIATPLATTLSVARAARSGIVVRGGRTMETAGTIDHIYFDKTGTITAGCPVILETITTDPDVEPLELLGRLAALESASEHALARAILTFTRDQGIETGTVRGVQVHPGRGISGMVTWQGRTCEVTAGTSDFAGTCKRPVKGPWTVIDVVWEGKTRGHVLLTDRMRTDAGQTVKALHSQNITSAILSGDRYLAALAMAEQCGIKRVEAPCRPEEKLAVITMAIAAGEKLAMVGDGINDAPALAAADVGIAFGAGMELARQAGNVIMFSDQLQQIPWLIGLSRYTGKIIKQNFAWSFLYNAIALGAAAAGLLHPLLAAVAMVVSSLTVLGNSLRVMNFPEMEPASLPQLYSASALPAENA